MLFVHGIGEQLQGQTLVRFGDPLANWFTRWLTEDTEVEPSLEASSAVALWKTELVPSAPAPAHAYMDVAYPKGGQTRSTWLLAESWWAETFRAPKTRTLLVWMLVILPYMLFEQFGVPVRRSVILLRQKLTKPWIGWLRVLAFSLISLASLPLAGLGLIVISVLLVPMVIPVKALRDPAERAALKLANTLGDAFILTSSSVQFDAMVQRVQTDLRWLSGQARTVVVVAHSQGAAISYEAIRRYGATDNLVAFVTLGQGLGKLMRVRRLRVQHRNYGYAVGWFGVAGFFLVVVFLTRTLTSSGTGGTFTLDVTLASLGAGIIGVAAVFFWLTVRAYLFKTPEPLVDAAGKDLPWTNMYASADPVPNGPFCDENSCPESLEEIEVWNRASVLRDHTYYTEVPDDFVGCLAERLLRARNSIDADLRSRLHEARWHSWWRVWWLAAMRLLSVLCATVDVYRIYDHRNLYAIGNRVAWLRDLVGHVATPFRKVFGLSTGIIGDAALTGIVVAVAGIVGAYVVFAIFWSLWARWNARDFFLHLQKGMPALGGFGFWLFLAALGQMGILGGLVGDRADYPKTWHDVAVDWLPWLIPWPVFVVLAFLLARFAGRPAGWIGARLMAWFPVRDPY